MYHMYSENGQTERWHHGDQLLNRIHKYVFTIVANRIKDILTAMIHRDQNDIIKEMFIEKKITLKMT